MINPILFFLHFDFVLSLFWTKIRFTTQMRVGRSVGRSVDLASQTAAQLQLCVDRHKNEGMWTKLRLTTRIVMFAQAVLDVKYSADGVGVSEG